MKLNKIYDSMVNLVNGLANTRNAQATNRFVNKKLDVNELREINKTGLYSKIVRVKSGYSLNNTIQFKDDASKDYYDKNLAKHVKNATKYMVGYGRGIIVLIEPGADLKQPLKSNQIQLDTIKFKSFSGDMVTPTSSDLDLASDRYMMPKTYTVRDQQIHWTRVIDFNYVMASEFELPQYRWGGISEAELIYPQLINDGIVERVTPVILEKNSTLFYKLDGFKEAVASGQQDNILKYFQALESARSIYGAGIVDKNDDIEEVSQTLSNLSEGDQITLRRIAMVTGIPLALLVGENVKGLNSTGDNEMQVFNEMIMNFQSDFLLEPINELMSKLGLPSISFKENQGETATAKVEYEGKVIENAVKLFTMGEDHNAYLVDKGIIKKTDFDSFWEMGEEDDKEDEMEENNEELEENEEIIGAE